MKKNMEYNYNIKKTKEFEKELDKIYRYIVNKLKEPIIAIKFINLVIKKLKILEYFPFAHKLIKRTKKFEYRKLIIKNYIIVYKINLKEKEITILHIYNQKVM